MTKNDDTFQDDCLDHVPNGDDSRAGKQWLMLATHSHTMAPHKFRANVARV